MTAALAREEWSAMWPLPIVAMFGIAGATLFPTSSGIFMQVLTGHFGWTHAQFALAFTFQVLLGLIAMPLAGRLADRIGPRKVALAGIVPFGVSFGLLGFASGSIWQWWALCLLNALCLASICPAIWIKPVVEGFHVSRGLALSIALGGIGLATVLWPPLAAYYAGAFGWRLAYPALAATWAVPMLVLTLACFDRRAKGPAAAALQSPAAARIGYRDVIASRTFICICAAGGLFACASYGLFLQLVAILQRNGIGLDVAATILSVFGLSSAIGRIGIGLLLDRLPTRPLGVAVFLLPIPAALILWQNDGSVALAVIAATLFGIAGGAETDILAYLAANRFPKKLFASVYANATALFAISASLGPLLAGLLYDLHQSYTPFLIAIIPLVAAGALLIGLIRPAETQAAQSSIGSRQAI